MSYALDALLIGTAIIQVLLTPYTKVEESFSLHAIHDVLAYGVGPEQLTNYDHFVFSGAVPRSFVGNVLLAWMSLPVQRIGNYLGLVEVKEDVLLAVRLTLTLINAFGLCLLRRSISRRFGSSTGFFFAIITCSQFHLPFWMGRTLPNMFALFPVNLAFSSVLNRSPNSLSPNHSSVHYAMMLLVFAGIILRGELALLLAPFLLQALALGWINVSNALKYGIISSSIAIVLTTVVDSYFWQQWPLWPEFYGIYFNIYQGKSSEWGVSPFHTYISSYIPKLLLSALPLAILGFIVEPRIRSTVVPPTVFVLLISFLGHKEWRFVIYTVPLFNIAAARGARWLSRQRGVFGQICLLGLTGLLGINLLVTVLMTTASMANYPGGQALSEFNALYANHSQVHVHIDNLAAQTGASLFLQEHCPPYPSYIEKPRYNSWVYNKTEHLSPQEIANTAHFTHAITEYPDGFPLQTWRAAKSIKAFDGLNLGGGIKGALSRGILSYKLSDKLWIMEKIKN